MSFEALIRHLNANAELGVQRIADDTLLISNGTQELKISTNPEVRGAWFVVDSWLEDAPLIVASKVLNRLGLSQRIHARKCEVRRVDKPVMDEFLLTHHLNGVAGAKHKFGLFYEEELVALVSFAAPRTFEGRKSAELVRYCVKSFCSIPGGLDKLLKSYVKEFPCDDIFTYVDLTWSKGDGFKNIGFLEEGIKEIKGRRMLKLRKLISKKQGGINDKNSFHPHT